MITSVSYTFVLTFTLIVVIINAYDNEMNYGLEPRESIDEGERHQLLKVIREGTRRVPHSELSQNENDVDVKNDLVKGIRNLHKRAFDTLGGQGFTGLDKRAFDTIGGHGFTGLDKRAFDTLGGAGFTGLDKRAFDTLGGRGFTGLDKRASDALHGGRFFRMNNKIYYVTGGGRPYRYYD
ncbi:hypothetical protein AB6A40_001863 [Gnathostoma spinigerum]|uniref:Uncharacterized protein n=1 Tax=Gnathostoma spinigerum TaxID=75299 RepID=A0ABD6ECV2_9BILA